MKVYKAVDVNLQCNDFQFVVGEKASHEGPLELCTRGFHACSRIFDLLQYKGVNKSRFFECEASDECVRDETKSCHRWIILVRELAFAEVFCKLNLKEDGSEFDLCKGTNLGFGNRGFGNNGNYNRGSNNQGNDNHGNDNHGNCHNLCQ